MFKAELEQKCWLIAFDEIKKRKYNLSEEQILYAWKCLSKYFQFEVKEFTEEKLINFKKEVNEFNKKSYSQKERMRKQDDDFNDQRIENLITYFILYFNKVDVKKLMTLFYLADVYSYINSAFSFSHFTYYAEKDSPFAPDLFYLLSKKFNEDGHMLDKNSYLKLKDEGNSFEGKYFSNFERDLLSEIYRRHKDSDVSQMFNDEYTYHKGTPWKEALNVKQGEKIDFNKNILKCYNFSLFFVYIWN